MTTIDIHFGVQPVPSAPQPLTLAGMLADARVAGEAAAAAFVQLLMARPIVPPPLAALQAGIIDPLTLAAMASMYATYTVPIYALMARALEVWRTSHALELA